MCGRYSITTPVEAMRGLFGFAGPGLNLQPRYNAAPTQELPVVRRVAEGDDRELVLLRWGLVPPWAKDVKIAARLINARAETVAEKPSFRAAFRRRRCLVPADGFYEWKKAAGGGQKQPFRIRLPDGGPFAFAGLWERWQAEGGEAVESFTIVTTKAAPSVRDIHLRMPVILPPAEYQHWLDPAADADDLGALLRPYEAALDTYPVATTVNNVRNDSPDCLKAVTEIPPLL
jgi:putative SOS response-associated peptidase YedK